MAKDPMCGMAVEETKSAASSGYRGDMYCYCAVGCKKARNADPKC